MAVLDKEQKKNFICILISGLIICSILLVKVYSGLNIDEYSNYLRLLIYLIPYIIVGHQVILLSISNLSKGRIFDENFLMTTTVRAKKYTLFPIPASVSGRSQRSIRNLGKVILIPTSTPTSTRIPIKKARMYLSLNNSRVTLKEMFFRSCCFSCIGVSHSHIKASSDSPA